MLDLVDHRSIEVYDAQSGARIAEFPYEFQRALLALDSQDRLSTVAPIYGHGAKRSNSQPLESAAGGQARCLRRRFGWACGGVSMILAAARWFRRPPGYMA